MKNGKEILEAIKSKIILNGYDNEVPDIEVVRAIGEEAGMSHCTIYHYKKLLEAFGILKRHPRFSKIWIINKKQIEKKDFIPPHPQSSI